MAIDFFFFDVSIFTFCVVLGGAVALAASYFYARRIQLPRDLFWNGALVVTLVGLVGARLYHVAMHSDYFAANPDEILNFDQGGLAWRGGLLAGMLALGVFTFVARRLGGRGSTGTSLPFGAFADVFAVGLPLALAIGWWGAHVRGIYFGAVNDSLFAQELPDAFGSYDLRFPVQLATGVWFAFVFIVLVWFRQHPRPHGQIAALFLLMSAVGNFALGFYRGDETLMWHTLRVDQWVDVFIAALGVVFIFLRSAETASTLRTVELKWRATN